jgi:hypothetical protein
MLDEYIVNILFVYRDFGYTNFEAMWIIVEFQMVKEYKSASSYASSSAGGRRHKRKSNKKGLGKK